MKVIAVLLLSIFIVASNCLSTYHFHHGDQLLDALQQAKGKTYVLMIAKDDSTDKKLQLTNARVADGLYHNVLMNPPALDADGKPTGDATERDVVWARVNADDEERKGHLLSRLHVDQESLKEWPTVVVMKNGVGSSMHGPTSVRHAMRHVDEFLA